MIYCQFFFCGQFIVIYYLVYWIKIDRIFRKNYGVFYFSDEVLN